jgi:ParB/RepB/Spo0J family partition protein
MVQSISKYGVIVALTAIRDGDGNIEIKDGLRRLAAAKLAGTKEVPVTFWDFDELGGDIALFMLNEQRSANPVAELAAIERVMGRAIGEAEIAKATGIKISTIRKRLNLRNLIPKMRELFNEYKLKPSVAEAASKMSEAEQKDLLRIYNDTGKLMSKHVAQIKKKHAGEGQPTLGKGTDDPNLSATKATISFDVIRDTVREYVPPEVDLTESLKNLTVILVANGMEVTEQPDWDKESPKDEDKQSAEDAHEVFQELFPSVYPANKALCAVLHDRGFADEEALKDWSGWRLIDEMALTSRDVLTLQFMNLLAGKYDPEAKSVKGYYEGQPLDQIDGTERHGIIKLTRGANGGAVVIKDGKKTTYNWKELEEKFTRV